MTKKLLIFLTVLVVGCFLVPLVADALPKGDVAYRLYHKEGSNWVRYLPSSGFPPGGATFGTNLWKHEYTVWNLTFVANIYQFYPFFNAGHFRLHAVVDAEFQKLLEGWYREGIERCRTMGEKNPFGIGVPFIWCSNNLVTALVTQCALYEQMTGDGRYREFATRHRDWLLGRNPWGTTQFMGVGIVSPTDVHLMTTREPPTRNSALGTPTLTGRALRGGLVDGPVYEHIFQSLKGVGITEPDPLADFQDPRAVYHNDFHDYSTNEPTMDGTASAILMWSALQMPAP